jgi:hypothetical protein
LVFALATALFVGVSSSSLASGTYAGGLPGLALQINPAQYELGKLIFLGRAKLSGPLEASNRAQAAQLETQRLLLGRWHAAVPEKARPETSLDRLAGQLQPPQQAALRYYLETRFRLKLEDK